MNGAEAIAGRFDLVNPHAGGSMGEVHHVRDLQTGDTVAVKVIWRHPTRRGGLADRGGQERRQIHAWGADHVAPARTCRGPSPEALTATPVPGDEVPGRHNGGVAD
jgi:hypothetical protein